MTQELVFIYLQDKIPLILFNLLIIAEVSTLLVPNPLHDRSSFLLPNLRDSPQPVGLLVTVPGRFSHSNLSPLFALFPNLPRWRLISQHVPRTLVAHVSLLATLVTAALVRIFTPLRKLRPLPIVLGDAGPERAAKHLQEAGT